MTVGNKPGAGGTDPTATGSDQQNVARPENAGVRQGSSMNDKTDKFDKSEGGTAVPWFDRQLNQLYTEVISEPLPKDFLELIDKLREKTSDKK